MLQDRAEDKDDEDVCVYMEQYVIMGTVNISSSFDLRFYFVYLDGKIATTTTRT